MGRCLFVLWLSLFATPSSAAERVLVCFDYGCASQAEAEFSEAQLARIATMLGAPASAVQERERLAQAIGQLYRWLDDQTPVGADRAGDYLDGEAAGRMDCIDHAATTTGLLALIERRGAMRFHRVVEQVRRSRFIFQHFSALIEEIEPAPLPAAPVPVPDYVAPLLALCDCEEVKHDIPRPIVEVPHGGHPGDRYVVDSWFVEHGQAAIVLPLDEWLDGGGPYVQ